MRVLVLGAGVSGLTSALELLRRGFAVTLLADRFAPDVTSVVAGALWERPPAVCGSTMEPAALRRAQAWSETSYEVFTDLAAGTETGVFLRPVTFYFPRPIDEMPDEREKVRALAETVREFRHDPALIEENGVGREAARGLRDAYTYLAPMVDTDVYLAWLLAEVRRLGALVREERVEGSLDEIWSDLLERHDAEVLVHCAGLGARELVGDTVERDALEPLRGALVRVCDAGHELVPGGHCVALGVGGDETEGATSFVFVVPRGRDRVVLGGLAEPGEWDVDLAIGSDHDAGYAPIREMHRRCVEFLPALEGAPIDAAEPLRVGLRPVRAGGVRLETDAERRIVHDYGHGGSGVTLSWGCAREVADRVEALVGSPSSGLYSGRRRGLELAHA